MTDAQIHLIQSKLTASSRHKLGYNRTYPHAVAFASLRLFGCGLWDLRIEQGLSQVQSILDYIGTDHKVGRVVLISLHSLQVEAGVSYDLLAVPNPPLPYLSECWLLSLRRFCAKYDVSLRVKLNKRPMAACPNWGPLYGMCSISLTQTHGAFGL